MKNLSNMPKNVTFQMVFVKNEGLRVRGNPQTFIYVMYYHQIQLAF